MTLVSNIYLDQFKITFSKGMNTPRHNCQARIPFYKVISQPPVKKCTNSEGSSTFTFTASECTLKSQSLCCVGCLRRKGDGDSNPPF